MRNTFRVFLSYPKSGRGLAEPIERLVTEKLSNGLWKDLLDIEVCMWDSSEAPVTLPAFNDPTSHIFGARFPPSQADLFIVCLTDRIGPGTMREVAERVARGGAGADFDIFFADQPPKRRENPEYEQQQRDYEELNDWLDAPFVVENGQRRPLGIPRPMINEISGEGVLLKRVEQRLGEVLKEKLTQASPTSSPEFHPYPGLTPLNETHRRSLYGRDREIQTINRHLSEGNRFLMVLGASGVGKSSLVSAGILGQLGGDTKGVTVRPTKEPAKELAEKLHPFIPGSTALDLRLEPETELAEIATAAAGDIRLVVFIDQFERLYTAPEREIAQFTRLLVALHAIPNCAVIIAHRDDQVPEWTRREDLSAPLAFNWVQCPVTHVRQSYLKAVIEKPALIAEKPRPEAALVDRLMDDFEGQRNATPLLALTLNDLYEMSGRGMRQMSLSDYMSRGGLKGIVDTRTRKLSERLQRFGLAEERLNALFALTVDITADGRPVSRLARRSEVTDLFASEALQDPREFVEFLIDQFFLRTEAAGDGEGGAVTLAHEIYFEEWPALRAWIEANEAQIRLVRDLEREARRWDESGRSPGYLLPGGRLPTANALVSQYADRFRAGDHELIELYLQMSNAHATEQQIYHALLRGDIAEADDLIKAGAKAPMPLTGDSFEPFYDAIWGAAEVESPRALADSGDSSVPINAATAELILASGFTPLHFAALAGRVDKIGRILALGVDIDIASAKGSTPLSLAAFAGQVEAVQFLLRFGANPHIATRENQFTPAGWASYRGHTEVLELLLNGEGHIDQSVPGHIARELLHSAVAGANGPALSRFLRALEGDDHEEVLGEALIQACRGVDAGIVDMLIAAGANPMTSTDDYNPAITAALYGSVAVLSRICDQLSAAELSAVVNGRTALTGAALSGRDNIAKVELLIERDADPNVQTPDLLSALLVATTVGDLRLAQRLLECEGLDVELRDQDGDSALNIAVNIGNLALVNRLLEHGAKPNVADNNHRTAAFVAAHRGYDAILQTLLLAGADPNQSDSRGFTPLHTAAAGGHLEAVNVLLADDRTSLSAVSARGFTALTLASREGHYAVAAMLLGRDGGQLLHVMDRGGWTPLTHAHFTNRSRVVELLFEAGARAPLWCEDARENLEEPDNAMD